MLRLIGVIWILDCGAAMFWALGRMRRAGWMPVRGISGPVAEIGLWRLSIEAGPVGKSKRLPQVFRIVVSHGRDKKAVQSMLDTLNCAYCVAGAEGFEPP